ncbi:hypothetical protein ACQ4PT_070292 [Festuca glaucescens]
MDLGLGASRPAVESVVIDDHALNIGVDEVLDPVMDEKVSSAVHDALALGMDLSPGLSFAKKVIHSTTSEPRIQFSTNAPLQSSTINDTNLIMEKSPIDQYIDWHRDDPLKERTLVYAVFPSAQVVPRDVVFGHYANVGGNHQSWTAVCYVLTADFADAMPADEDQMPVDGNPHPLPGPVLDELVKPPTKRAKTQTKKLKGKKSPMQHEHDSKEPKPPQTPIHVLQAVGISLGIDPSKLTMEQLTTTPVMAKKSQVSDD